MVRATRDRLMTATAELFRRRGYHGTGLKDVTTSAEATTGSLYHFFPGGKVELAAAVIAETGVVYQQLYELIADEHDDPAGGVRAFFDGAAAALEEVDFVDICPIATVAGEIASTDDRLRQVADEVFTGWTAAAAVRFRAAGMSPQPAGELATTVIAALQGAILLARCRRDAAPVRVAGALMADVVAARTAAAAATRGRRGVRSAGRARR